MAAAISCAAALALRSAGSNLTQSEADDLATMFRAASTLRGRVRIDMPQSLVRVLCIPRLPELLGAYPHLELQLSTTDRRVDVSREGFDCVLRVGKLADSGLMARRLCELPMTNCASPSYLTKHGTPRSLDDLDGHLVVRYSTRFGTDVPDFEYRDGTVLSRVPTSIRLAAVRRSACGFKTTCHRPSTRGKSPVR
jgi:DNA-binding transcriptional LysR family regulator